MKTPGPALLLATALCACGAPPTTPPAPKPQHAVGGKAWFFDMRTLGQLDIVDVEGATVSLLETPSITGPVAADGAFRLEGVEEGSEFTLALTHPDWPSMLTGTFTMGAADMLDFTFQELSKGIVKLTSRVLGIDPDDRSLCTMITTVEAADASHDIWAKGEPGAVVTTTPEAPRLVYTDEYVLPDTSLEAASTDGGVFAPAAPPGTYVWTATKTGRSFDTLKMRCVPGWITDASPPRGLAAHAAP